MHFWHSASYRRMIAAILMLVFSENLLSFETFHKNECLKLINFAFAKINFGDSQTFIKKK